MNLVRIVFFGLALAACESGGTLIVASEGGTVTSEDGELTLVIPPGALDADTRISVAAIEEAAWPVDAPLDFVRVGAVYAVTPPVQLRQDAYAVQVFSALPAPLESASGDPAVAVSYLYGYSDDKVRPAPSTRTVLLADGRVAIVATLYELGVHWIGERLPGVERQLVMISSSMEAQAGEHAVGEEWLATRAALSTDLPIALVSREAHASVSTTGSTAVAPIVPSGWTRASWDATWDRDLGLHPWEVFDIHADGRSETIASFVDLNPITMDGELSPVVPQLPGWSCTGTGSDEGTLWMGVDVVSGASAGTIRAGVIREIGTATCR